MPFRNRQAFVKRVERAVVDDLKKRESEFETQGTRFIQEAISYLNVFQSGNLRSRSNMKQFAFGNSIIWRFQTEDVDYDIYPRNGLGSSRQYGPRKYDVLGAVRMARFYNLGINISDNVGRPRR